MKEFMFYIRNEKDAKGSLTADQYLAFIKKCETYIGILKSENKLIAAQHRLLFKKTEGCLMSIKNVHFPAHIVL